MYVYVFSLFCFFLSFVLIFHQFFVCVGVSVSEFIYLTFVIIIIIIIIFFHFLLFFLSFETIIIRSVCECECVCFSSSLWCWCSFYLILVITAAAAFPCLPFFVADIKEMCVFNDVCVAALTLPFRKFARFLTFFLIKNCDERREGGGLLSVVS